MPAMNRLLPMILALALATPLAAQQATDGSVTPPPAPAPADGTAAPAADGTAPAVDAAAPAEDGIGAPYVAESFDDWQLRCIRTEDGADPCQLYQLLKDKTSGNPVAEMSLVALPEGGEATAGATMIVPLETLLTEQLSITVDSGKSKRYPFTFCAEVGCVARVGFTKEDMDAFRKGKTAIVSVVPVANPEHRVDVEISLKGFTAGFEAVKNSAAPKQ